MLVAGVDGCEAGWIVVHADVDRLLGIRSVRVVPTFSDVVRSTSDYASIGIDVPIGLSDNGRRLADTEARKVLSPLRHNSVFPAPVRPVLGAPNYQEACRISASVRPDGKKISKQTYFLSFKIADVDRVMVSEPGLQERVFEIHPEVCFWAMNGKRPMDNYKKTGPGEAERIALLSEAFADDMSTIDAPIGAARDDVLDACAAAWTAARFARGEAGRLPEDPPLDSRGLRMEMVY